MKHDVQYTAHPCNAIHGKRHAPALCRAGAQHRAGGTGRDRPALRWTPAGAQQLREPRLSGGAGRWWQPRGQVLPPWTLEPRPAAGRAPLRPRDRGRRDPAGRAAAPRRADGPGSARGRRGAGGRCGRGRYPLREPWLLHRCLSPPGRPRTRAGQHPRRAGHARAHRAVHRPHPPGGHAPRLPASSAAGLPTGWLEIDRTGDGMRVAAAGSASPVGGSGPPVLHARGGAAASDAGQLGRGGLHAHPPAWRLPPGQPAVD